MVASRSGLESSVAVVAGGWAGLGGGGLEN